MSLARSLQSFAAMTQHREPARDGLSEHQLRVGRLSVAALGLLGPPIVVVEVASGVAVPRRAFVFGCAWTLTWGVLYLFGRAPAVRRSPESYVLISGLLLVAFVCATPWLAWVPHARWVQYCVVIPVLVGGVSFFPPTRMVALSAIALGAAIATERAALGAVVAPHVTVGAALAFAATGAVSSHVGREIWRRLERSKAHLVAVDRLGHLGRMTAALAHELKTPIAATDGALVTLADLADELERSAGAPGVTPDDLREIAADLRAATAIARTATRRAAEYVGAIRQHTRHAGAGRDALDVGAHARVAATLLAPKAHASGVTVDIVASDADAFVLGDPGKLDQLLTNLVDNAIDAVASTGRPGRVQVRVAAFGDAVRIEVEDDGPGVPPALRHRIFDYLFTTKRGAGTGLGLAICRDVAVGEFRGDLWLEDAHRGTGARFVARLDAGARSTEPESLVYEPAPAS